MVGEHPGRSWKGALVALIRVVAILVAGALPAIVWPSCSEARTRSRIERRRVSSIREYVRIEMGLRSAAVRRHEARTGHLPESWAEVDLKGLDIRTWATWIREDPAGERHAETNEEARDLAMRVEMEGELIDLYPWEKARPEQHDGAGLPVLLRRGHPPPDEHSWLRSSDPLPPSVTALLESRGAVPPVRTPFAVRSLVLRDATESARSGVWKVRIARGLILGVPLILLLAFAFFRRGWGARIQALAVGVAGVAAVGIAAAVVILGYSSGRVMCYSGRPFTPSMMSPHRRLAILEDAVARGEVAPDVAARARAYIETVGEE